MQLHSINAAQRLYVMPCGKGFTCYGFDVLDRKARAVATWATGKAPDLPAVGTAEHFAACSAIMADGAQHAARTGQRCPAELCPQLVGLEGRTVRATYFGERVRFRVGKSTGWMPAHLLLKTARSTGGEAIFPDQLSDVVAA